MKAIINSIKTCGLLVVALLTLCSCDSEVVARVKDPETTPTQISINLITTTSKDGFRSHRMQTPLMERYELAKLPFSEFRKGIHVETFNDSTALIESELTAEYAKFDEINEVWEARGNVIGRNHTDNKTLYTEQLFWDQKTDKIYSDKRVKVVDDKEIHIGTGFESNGAFTIWSFRKPMGRMEVVQDTTSQEEVTDSTQMLTSSPIEDDPREGLPVYSSSGKSNKKNDDKRKNRPSSTPLIRQ